MLVVLGAADGAVRGAVHVERLPWGAGADRGGRCKGRPIQGLVINNRIANVGTAHGEEYALRVREWVGEAVGIDPGLLVPSSTGIIGWELPVERMCEEVEGLVRGVGSADGLALARAIMTTDAYSKLCGVHMGEGMVWEMAQWVRGDPVPIWREYHVTSRVDVESP